MSIHYLVLLAVSRKILDKVIVIVFCFVSSQLMMLMVQLCIGYQVYLCGKIQQVKIGSCLLLGVLQKSILGSLFFSVFINDIEQSFVLI